MSDVKTIHLDKIIADRIFSMFRTPDPVLETQGTQDICSQNKKA